MPADVDLGHMGLEHPLSGLALSFSHTARFSSLSTDSDSVLEGLSVSKLRSASAWVSRGANLRLVFNITWSSLEIRNPDVLKTQLFTTFRDAVMWNQLDLQPSLTVEPSIPYGTSLLVVVSLHPLLSLATKKPPPHRLDQGVPFNHLKPPEDIPHLTLDQVNIYVDLHPDSRLRRCGRQNSGPTAHESPLSHNNPGEDLVSSETMLDIHPYEMGHARGFSSSTEQTLKAPDNFNHVGASSTVRHDPFVCHDTVTSLVDAAFRLSVSTLPARAITGMKVTELSSFIRLEDVCPAVWSPGYLQAMASRAMLLPTISHALSYSVRETARSHTLSAKLGEIVDQESSATSSRLGKSPDLADRKQYARFLQRAINTRLWRLMQGRLHDHAAARTLKLLHAGLISRPDYRGNYGQMLGPDTGENATSHQNQGENNDLEYDADWEDLFEGTRECDAKSRTDPWHPDNQVMDLFGDDDMMASPKEFHDDCLLMEPLVSVTPDVEDLLLLESKREDDVEDPETLWDW